MNAEEFRKIVREEAQAVADNINVGLVEQTVVKVLASFGIENPKQMNRIILFVEDRMRASRDMRKGFFSKVGAYFATVLLTVGGVVGFLKYFSG